MDRYYKENARRNLWDFGMGCEIGEVRITGTETVGMPMWMINNYIKSTCDNYTKLLYILHIIDIFTDMDPDIVDIGISTKSVPIDQNGKDFEEELIGYVERPRSDRAREKYFLMLHPFEKEEKEEREKKKKKDFWHYFNSCERPICFAVTKANKLIFLHDPRGGEGIKVRDISYHSPIEIGFGGLISCLDLLVNAEALARDEKRRQEEHEAFMEEHMARMEEHDANMMIHAMDYLERKIRIQRVLKNSDLPEGQKIYMQNEFNLIIERKKS